MEDEKMVKPLYGIRILEWAVWLAGPGATMMLGDLGAEVLKIEQPVVGDPSRGIKRLEGVAIDRSATERAFEYTVANRNKKSIIIDVTNPKGREVVYRLVQKCDVFLQNFRKGVRERAKLDYTTLSQYNSKIIYVNVSALGPDGPDSWRRGNDYVGQARSGFMSNMQEFMREPAALGGAIADHMTSIIAAYGILAALLARERMGIGQEIAVSLTGSMIALQHFRLANTFFFKRDLVRGNRKRVTNPLANHYKCKDGKWIVLCILASDVVWPDFCQAVGIQELEDDPRFAATEKRAENNRELIGILDKVFATKPRDEWVEIIGKYKRIMFSPVNEGMDVSDDPEAVYNKYVVDYEQPNLGKLRTVGCPVKFYETPAGIQAPAPEFGENTEQVLLDVGGYSWDEIAQLKEERAIG
jgi:crotonobetainyl-CoA:carnitine CoA-transferase CaiB-like acyl-CoA transferase